MNEDVATSIWNFAPLPWLSTRVDRHHGNAPGRLVESIRGG
jgi:hypothetical protein